MGACISIYMTVAQSMPEGPYMIYACDNCDPRPDAAETETPV